MSAAIDPAPKVASADRLTGRESQIMDALMQGARRGELAENLGVSPNTVKFHLKNIYSKLGVRSRRNAIHAYQCCRAQIRPLSRTLHER